LCARSPLLCLNKEIALELRRPVCTGSSGDERDIVRLRTNYRLEDVYLYHLIPAIPLAAVKTASKASGILLPLCTSKHVFGYSSASNRIAE